MTLVEAPAEDEQPRPQLMALDSYRFEGWSHPGLTRTGPAVRGFRAFNPLRAISRCPEALQVGEKWGPREGISMIPGGLFAYG